MTPSDTNLEFLSGSEREKRLKKRLKPAAEYAEEREERVGDQVEKVQEDMERNRDLSEALLPLRLALHEREEKLKEKLGADLEGVANMQSYDAKQWGEMKQLFGAGQYALTVSAGKDGKPEIAVEMTLAEGNVQEKVPLNAEKQREILSQIGLSQGGDEKSGSGKAQRRNGRLNEHRKAA